VIIPINVFFIVPLLKFSLGNLRVFSVVSSKLGSGVSVAFCIAIIAVGISSLQSAMKP